MPVNVTFKCPEVVFGSTHWTASTTGGPIEVGYQYSSKVIEHRAGDDQYPTVVALPDRSCSLTVTLCDVKCVLPINDTPKTLSFTITGKDSDTKDPVSVTVSFATMVLISINGSQHRSRSNDDFGTCILRFVHQSALGALLPVSVP